MAESDQPQGPDTPLFEDFPRPTYDDWYEAAVAMLRGAPFDKKLITRTLEGFDLQPLYRQQDTDDITHQHTLPGQLPYVRGIDTTGYLLNTWDIAQSLPYTSPQDFNAALRHDMERGQTAILLDVDKLALSTLEDLATALDRIDLESVPVLINGSRSPLVHTALLVALMQQRQQDPTKLHGAILADPLGDLATNGSLPASLQDAYNEILYVTQWAAFNEVQWETIGVHSTPYHESGADAVEELAFTIATGVAYIRAMLERGLSIDRTARHIRFVFAIGPNFFMEIAKLRAARLLWSQVVGAFGGSDEAQKMRIHAHTAHTNKTLHDPYVNMLRTTTEAMAAAVAGVQSMQVSPFDAIAGPPDEFSRRIARNQQLILQQECNLTQLIDPAGGSWTVEYLTDQLAQRAWTLFQKVEAMGGMSQALMDGFPQTKIVETAIARTQKLQERRDVLVGTNMYPNLSEEPLSQDTSTPEPAPVSDTDYPTPNHMSSNRKLSAAVYAILQGDTVAQVADSLRHEASPTVNPLYIHRAAYPFERLRRDAKDHESRTGQPPQIFLANMGPLVQHKARADFVTGFFEVGGFDITYPDGFETPEEAAQAAIKAGAPVVVICSTDNTYPEIVPPLVKAIKAEKPDIYVILAGYPKDQIEAHTAAGVDDFVHIRSNCYLTNFLLQQRIGVRE